MLTWAGEAYLVLQALLGELGLQGSLFSPLHSPQTTDYLEYGYYYYYYY